MEFKGTPGPWRWELNEKAKSISLCGGGGVPFDLTVMDFVRYGMNSAAPTFMGDLFLERAEKFGKAVEGREHHAHWFKDISHPDALLISKAPELLENLIIAKDFLEKLGMMLTSEYWTEEFRTEWNDKMHKIETLLEEATTV